MIPTGSGAGGEGGVSHSLKLKTDGNPAEKIANIISESDVGRQAVSDALPARRLC